MRLLSIEGRIMKKKIGFFLFMSYFTSFAQASEVDQRPVYPRSSVIKIDPAKQSPGLNVYSIPTPLFSMSIASGLESKERIAIEDEKSKNKIDIRFNDIDYEFKKERDDFANQEVKLFEIATNSHGTKIRQGLVFLHAVITNYGPATKIRFSKIAPTLVYEEDDLELLENGEWVKERTHFNLNSQLRIEPKLSVPKKETRINHLSADDFVVSIKAFLFKNSETNVKTDSNIEKELLVEDE